MKTLEIIHGFSCYRVGELATFPDDHADRLVVRGLAKVAEAEVAAGDEPASTDQPVKTRTTRRSESQG